MTNPFRSGGDNPYDRPLINGQLDTRGAQQSDQTVLFDAATKTISPSGQAMLTLMMDQLRTEQAKTLDVLGDVLAETVQPLLDRIDVLERALDVRKADTAKAIQADIDGFMGTDDDAPTKDQLKAMMQQHTKKMAGVRNG
ncbi:hypothetical protein [Ruegeria arenilitoris]|uniref:hypothetical protein n=1 Tax=Ruegeria arenilitoris TaxID=1173585 RepID=UPI00147D5582|nr:hypothetical protein [Ruegeria arenilitoris]